jgi:hypothetical protein
VLDALPPEDARWFSETAGWTTTATAHRNNARKATWLLPTEIVAGEKPTPFQHVAAAASGTKALIRSLEFQDGLVLVVDRQIRGGHDPSPKTHSGKPIDDGARCGTGQPGLHRGLGDLPGPAFDQWGWRVLFFCGLLSALLSLFVLRKVEGIPGFPGKQRAPVAFRELVRGRGKKILALNIAVAAGGGAQYYLTSGYLPTLLSEVVGVPPGQRGTILLVSSVLVIGAAIAAGHLSERLGRRRTMLGFGLCNLFALPLLTWGIAAAGGDRGGVVALLCVVMVMLSNAAYSPLMIFLNEQYPAELRARGTAVSWNLGFMLGGADADPGEPAQPGAVGCSLAARDLPGGRDPGVRHRGPGRPGNPGRARSRARCPDHHRRRYIRLMAAGPGV